MESSRKRLRLIKGKLVKSLYRAASIQYGSSSIRVPNCPSEGFVVNQMDRPSIIHHLNHHNNHDHHQPKQKLVPYNPNSTTAASFSSSSAAVDFILNQEKVTVPQKPKVSLYIPPDSTDTPTYHNYAKLDSESVDLKAASYISSVQERFRLEHINSERKQFPHHHQEVLQLHQ
ncbi:hypothetical protein RND71_034048 [Anisodus tanguticus]|uniref:Uncharacterized protein n=1 Tax=Anisodus tanguticus TaxID=243964 RepID=A0AAE1V3T8_9SOLA|nr:hypothetical protein RND71_034048 [Anisodus tanguticus]